MYKWIAAEIVGKYLRWLGQHLAGQPKFFPTITFNCNSLVHDPALGVLYIWWQGPYSVGTDIEIRFSGTYPLCITRNQLKNGSNNFIYCQFFLPYLMIFQSSAAHLTMKNHQIFPKMKKSLVQIAFKPFLHAARLIRWLAQTVFAHSWRGPQFKKSS